MIVSAMVGFELRTPGQNTQSFYSLPTESRPLFNMMKKSNYHINAIVGCKPRNMINISLCAEPQSFCKVLHSSLNI